MQLKLNLKLGLRQRLWLRVILFSGLILGSYNNCTKGFETAPSDMLSQSSFSGSNSSGVCEESLQGLFERGYYTFLKTNCTTCHSSDPAVPQFASSDANWAYKVFMDKGYTRVSDNAISPTHNPPYSGVQHTQTVNELRLEWQQGVKEFNSCKGAAAIDTNVDPAEMLSLETAQKAIPALALDGTAQVQ